MSCHETQKTLVLKHLRNRGSITTLIATRPLRLLPIVTANHRAGARRVSDQPHPGEEERAPLHGLLPRRRQAGEGSVIEPETFDFGAYWTHVGDLVALDPSGAANRAKDRHDEALDAMRVHNGMTLDEFLAHQ